MLEAFLAIGHILFGGLIRTRCAKKYFIEIRYKVFLEKFERSKKFEGQNDACLDNYFISLKWRSNIF